MTIQEEMLKDIVKEIDEMFNSGNANPKVNINKAKEVAKMLTYLSTGKEDPESLTNQYIAKIKIICNNAY